MILAWRNLCHDRARFLVTLVGIAFAVFLITFQGSLLFGFIGAASRMIGAAGGDLWISAPGVPCFDFAGRISRQFADLTLGVDGILEVRGIAAGFATLEKPSGHRQVVLLVGADPALSKAFPLPYLEADAMLHDGVVADESNRDLLELRDLPAEIQVAGQRAVVTRLEKGFGSFLGSPYIFTHLNKARELLGFSGEQASYFVARVDPRFSIDEVRKAVALRLPNADVWTASEFARRSSLYWLIQTGAGGAFLTAALLAFIIGTVIMSQTIYAMTMENIEEFAVLKALGAANRYIRGVVLMQAAVSGVIGAILGLALSFPLVRAATHVVAWVSMPSWLPGFVFLLTLAMCALASVASLRGALGVEPGRVFRV